MHRPCQHHIGQRYGPTQSRVDCPGILRQTSLFETGHFESERLRRRSFSRAPVDAKRLLIQQLQARRSSRHRGENKMAQFATAAIITDARTGPVFIQSGRQTPAGNPAIIQPPHPRLRVVPGHLPIARMPAGPGVIRILQPGQITFYIVKETASAIDQQGSEQVSVDCPPNEYPINDR